MLNSNNLYSSYYYLNSYINNAYLNVYGSSNFHDDSQYYFNVYDSNSYFVGTDSSWITSNYPTVADALSILSAKDFEKFGLIGTNAVTFDGATLVHFAAYNGSVGLLGALLDALATRSLTSRAPQSKPKPTTTTVAVPKGLSGAEIALNQQDAFGNTPLHYAALSLSKKASECITKMLSYVDSTRKNAVINAQNSTKSTPVHYAALSAHINMNGLPTLLSQLSPNDLLASVVLLDSNKSSPLHYAYLGRIVSPYYPDSKQGAYDPVKIILQNMSPSQRIASGSLQNSFGKNPRDMVPFVASQLSSGNEMAQLFELQDAVIPQGDLLVQAAFAGLPSWIWDFFNLQWDALKK